MLTRNLHPISVAAGMAKPIVALFLWAHVVMVVHTLGHHPEFFGMEPGVLFDISKALAWTDVGIPFSAIAALGGALAIFLGFRNNSAYDRWWEARKIWGALINDSRSWARQVVAWAEGEDAESLRKDLVHRHLAFVHGLAHHLRGQQAELLQAVARFVPASEAARYEQVPNVVTALLIEQGKAVARARASGGIEHFRHLQMDSMLSNFSDHQGKCERIKKTPLPRQYDAFPRWFVYFYCALLPFGLVQSIGWGTVPIAMGISVLFLALESSGRMIEDPFENEPMDTPMTALAGVIERDLRAALGEPVPDAVVPDERGVLM